MITRIQEIMQEKKLSPSQFADEIGVQRSGISHILSGRNKPSLDFILKVLGRFTEVNASWLLFGKFQEESMDDKKLRNSNIKITEEPEKVLIAETPIPFKGEEELLLNEQNKKNEIDKVLFFYTDKTFREYSPEQ